MRRGLTLLTTAVATVVTAAPAHAETFGRSAEGRALQVTHHGDPAAPHRILVVGSIHGNETAGHAVVRALRRGGAPDGVRLDLVTTVNPDGVRAGTRQNARGVDLNRNFPHRWRGGGRPGDTYYPGRRAASEPETRAVRRLVRRTDPDVTVWFHQHLRLVVDTPGADRALLRRYARRVRLPLRRLPRYRGTATGWQNRRDRSASAFVVELAAGRLGRRAVRRHARAILATARDRTATATATAEPERPEIRWDPIPFGKRRVRQMRRYAVRHYGLHRARLIDPKVIVEHYTATSTYGPVFNTFAANQPDPELGELPGTCAHFVVDTDGTIHQLVRLKWMCRHTVGLNYTALGIEHVGRSDEEVLGNERQMEASLALTRWLQARYGIARADVIGHAESLSSPHHRERVRRLRRQTHGDFAPAAMRRYRARL